MVLDLEPHVTSWFVTVHFCLLPHNRMTVTFMEFSSRVLHDV
jgi:hypothetical protein